MPPSVSQARRRAGKIGGLVTRSRHNPADYTLSARTAFRESFVQAVDPDGTLPEAEREARADALRRAHYARLAARSAQVRARKPR